MSRWAGSSVAVGMSTEPPDRREAHDGIHSMITKKALYGWIRVRVQRWNSKCVERWARQGCNKRQLICG